MDVAKWKEGWKDVSNAIRERIETDVAEAVRKSDASRRANIALTFAALALVFSIASLIIVTLH